VVYQPGELKVAACRNGKPWAENTTRTTGPAKKLMVSADRAKINNDGLDLAYITVTVADKDVLLVPRTDPLVKFALSGPGEIVAVGNGNPRDELKARFPNEAQAGKDFLLECRNSPMLRKSFPITKPVREAQVSIVGLGYYELYPNGAKAGDHVPDPAWTSYHRNTLYVTYDIGGALKLGQNALGVQPANGMYNQGRPDTWLFHKAPWKAFPQMRLQLDVSYQDGTRERIVSDTSWKASSGPICHDHLRVGVMYDARREQPGWNTPEFDDSKWQPAVLRGGVTGTLAAQMSEPIKVMKTLKPVNITAGANGVYEVDFGQNIAGWSRLKVSGAAGAKIRGYRFVGLPGGRNVRQAPDHLRPERKSGLPLCGPTP